MNQLQEKKLYHIDHHHPNYSVRQRARPTGPSDGIIGDNVRRSGFVRWPDDDDGIDSNEDRTTDGLTDISQDALIDKEEEEAVENAVKTQKTEEKSNFIGPKILAQERTLRIF